MYLVQLLSATRLVCVFDSCNHASAVAIAHHEFAKRPAKPVCPKHYEVLKLFEKRGK